MSEQSSVSRRKPIKAGERHGRLVALERVGQDAWRAALWRFKCDCGNRDYVARPDQVRRGLILSCGCHKSEVHAERMRSRSTHGFTRRGLLLNEYRSWQGMNARCNNPNAPNYEWYGGRGIKVCEKWGDFRAFLMDMGFKPAAHYSIGRIDNDGHYCPENCRWETPKQQSRNQKTNVLVNFDGQSMCLQDACDRAGILRNVVEARLRRGWTTDRALSVPVKYHRPRKDKPKRKSRA